MDRVGKGSAAKAVFAERGFAFGAEGASRGSLGASVLACLGCLAGVALLIVGLA